MSNLADLHQLARHYRVSTRYRDSFGQEQEASPEALVQVLACLGVPLRSPEDATDALVQHRRQRQREALSPFTALWQGRPQRLVVGHLGQQAGERDVRHFALDLALEGGLSLRLEGRADDLAWADDVADGPGGATVDLGALLKRSGAGFEELPIGEHTATLHGPRGDASKGSVLVAPVRAWVPEQARQWGVFAPTYALRGGSLGVADLGQLQELTEWVGRQGGQMVGTLPLLAQFLEELYEPSPYSPVSRLFWNEFFLNLEQLPEWAECSEARKLFERAEVREEVARLAAADRVDYRRAARLKRRLLGPLAEAFFATGRDREGDFQTFLKATGALRYAQFRAVVERRQVRFSEWPERLRGGRVEAGDYAEADCRYHLYCQYRMGQQMQRLGESARGLGLGLYLDLPVGVHAAGYDLWAEPEAFLLGCCAGAPPDVVFRGGQNWGLAPLSPAGLRAQGYRYFRDVIRHHLSCAGALRIDHVMGLERIYCIPHGLDARSGVYVGYCAEELFAVLTLESARYRSELVGEDLGTVPPGLPEALAEHRVRRMHVVECALDGGTLYWGSLTPSAVVSVNTHDIVPFAAWCEGKDIDARQASGQSEHTAQEERSRRRQVVGDLAEQLAQEGHLDAALVPAVRERLARPQHDGGTEQDPTTQPALAALFAALLSRLARSDSPLMVVNLEDLWLETRPQNTPGTDSSCANWENKARWAVAQLDKAPWAAALLERVARGRGDGAPQDHGT